MKLQIKSEALKITGFQLCEFEGDNDIECATCDEVIPHGKNVYYERTCYEVEEGDYHCEECTEGKPAEMEAYCDSIEATVEFKEQI